MAVPRAQHLLQFGKFSKRDRLFMVDAAIQCEMTAEALL